MKKDVAPMPADNEKGIAIVLSLFLMMAMSIVGASLMFLAQTETYSSMNYRLMSQARYGAESGVQRAANYLMFTYAAPGGAGDPLANYDMTKSPVEWNGEPVVLSANANKASHYPIPAVQAAFLAAATGTLPSGNTSVQYAAYATLLTMQQVTLYGSTNNVSVMTWQITSDGSISVGRTATIQVTATLEQQIVPGDAYAAFATGAGCGSLTFGGGETIDSYDSRDNVVVAGVSTPTVQQTGGHVGTNGNLTLSGQATVYGSLFTPRTGVGGCSSGAVDALDVSNSATVVQGIVKLPQQVTLLTPAVPATCCPTGTTNFNTPTFLVGGTAAAPTLGNNLNGKNGGVLHLTAGYYAFNSISLGAGSSIVIDSGPVIMTIAGVSQTTPIDFGSGGISNTSVDASMFQILYPGTGTIKLNGGAQTAMVLYAPNANAQFPSSNSDFYGSVIASTVAANGAHIHYDRHLGTELVTLSGTMFTSFSWKKY
jgi:hypothetical protein